MTLAANKWGRPRAMVFLKFGLLQEQTACSLFLCLRLGLIFSPAVDVARLQCSLRALHTGHVVLVRVLFAITGLNPAQFSGGGELLTTPFLARR